ncbi:MAG: cytochrome c maturation protein CcmE [Saprospiraceae bacterium]|jgi:cytochrome c-type biogenesis protein CcmE
MKKTHIVALLAIVSAIAIIINGARDVSTYASFADAAESGTEVKVTGELNLDEEIIYQPEIDPNVFSFHMLDNNGESRKVIMKQAKPQDFERSESIVVTGELKNEVFVADEILMKCPSKYKDDEVRIRAES